MKHKVFFWYKNKQEDEWKTKGVIFQGDDIENIRVILEKKYDIVGQIDLSDYFRKKYGKSST